MLSLLPRFWHFQARKLAAGRSAQPSGTLLHFLLQDWHTLLEFENNLDNPTPHILQNNVCHKFRGCIVLWRKHPLLISKTKGFSQKRWHIPNYHYVVYEPQLVCDVTSVENKMYEWADSICHLMWTPLCNFIPHAAQRGSSPHWQVCVHRWQNARAVSNCSRASAGGWQVSDEKI